MSINVQTGGMIDATQYGVTGDGSDQTAALQYIVNNMPLDSWIYLPNGNIHLTAMIDVTYNVNGKGGLLDNIRMVGSPRTKITGSFSAPLIGRNVLGLDITGAAYFKGIEFDNFDANGIGVQLEQMDGVLIDDCIFKAHSGLVIGRFRTLEQNMIMRNIGVYSSGFDGEVGLDISAGHMDIYGLRCFSSKGIAASLGGGINVFGFHMEENNVAISTGNRRQYGGIIAGGDMEANLTHIQVTKPTSTLILQCANIYGDKRNGSQWPDYGIDIQAGAGNVSLLNSTIGGSFVKSAVHLAGNGSVIIDNCNAGNRDNGQGGSLLVWDVQMDRSKISTRQSNISL